MVSEKTSAVIFADHNKIVVRCLKVLLAHGVHVPLVITHDNDSLVGNVWYESIADTCREEAVPVIMSQDVKSSEMLSQIQNVQPDFIFSFDYPHILPVDIVTQARRGAYNFYGSLVPKYLGPASVQWAILNGETKTGVTLHEMEQKPDSGAAMTQLSVPILPDDTAFDVMEKVSVAAEKLLWDSFPQILEGSIAMHMNMVSGNSYHTAHEPVDGHIDWSQCSQNIYNLHRAVAFPYGAWTEVCGRKLTLGKARLSSRYEPELTQGLTVMDDTIVGVCGDGMVIIIQELLENGCQIYPSALKRILQVQPSSYTDNIQQDLGMEKRILILGINGFIGHHLLRQILLRTTWTVVGMDLDSDRITDFLNHEKYKSRFFFQKGDMTVEATWVEAQIRSCDVVLPLAAKATPSAYVRDPLSVFELDFEANLGIVRLSAKHRKRLVFPSTSEVYGMCHDEEYDPQYSELVYGPISKTRWIYACSKQLLDRVIWAYGKRGLNFTLFRPFNWFGSGLDSLTASEPGSSRVITQFLGHILRGEDLTLVDGGAQRRAFTYIDDGIDALVKIIADTGDVTNGKIYNIGNSDNDYSIRELALMMLELSSERFDATKRARTSTLNTIDGVGYYGEGYQDIQHRVPKINNTREDLDWQPTVSLKDALSRMLDDAFLSAQDLN